MNQNKANIFEFDLSKYVFKNDINTGRKEIMKVMLLMKITSEFHNIYMNNQIQVNQNAFLLFFIVNYNIPE